MRQPFGPVVLGQCVDAGPLQQPALCSPSSSTCSCLYAVLALYVLHSQDAKQMMETNFLSVVALTKEVVKGMMERNRGHIVNMSSIAGKEAYHGVCANVLTA